MATPIDPALTVIVSASSIADAIAILEADMDEIETEVVTNLPLILSAAVQMYKSERQYEIDRRRRSLRVVG